MGLHIAAATLAGILLFFLTGGCIVFLLIRWNKERDYTPSMMKKEEL